jgi:diguanylate cyclase (GGDEF)-like protein
VPTYAAQLLKQIAAAWSSALRSVDRPARYGGDEFAAVLAGCRLDDAQKLFDRLVDATLAHHGFSVGIAEWDGTQDVRSLMAEADARLYQAKRARTNLVITANCALGGRQSAGILPDQSQPTSTSSARRCE